MSTRMKIGLAFLAGLIIAGLGSIGLMAGANVTGYVQLTTPTSPATSTSAVAINTIPATVPNTPTRTPTRIPTREFTSTSTPVTMTTATTDCLSHDHTVYVYSTVENGKAVFYSSDSCAMMTNVFEQNNIGVPVIGVYMPEVTTDVWNNKFHPYRFECPIQKRESTCGFWTEDSMMFQTDPQIGWSMPASVNSIYPKLGIYNRVFTIGNPTATPTTGG